MPLTLIIIMHCGLMKKGNGPEEMKPYESRCARQDVPPTNNPILPGSRQDIVVYISANVLSPLTIHLTDEQQVIFQWNFELFSSFQNGKLNKDQRLSIQPTSLKS